MSSTPPIQDMPPKGGYAKINFARVPAKKLFTGIQIIAGVLLAHAGAMHVKLNIIRPLRRMEEIEMRSASIALDPFLMAEKDRRALLQMRKNRDAEAELMKDVEGWEVGKWQGEPVFKTVGGNEWVDPVFDEYYAHSDPSDLNHYYWCAFRH